VLLAAAAMSQLLPERREVVPVRRQLVDFPMTIAGRVGTREAIDKPSLEILQLDDYVLANFGPTQTGDGPVNLYVAWYDTQRAGRVAHSPSTCLPAGGWTVEKFTQAELAGVRIDGHAVRVNRAIIRRGNARQLAYYFFKQRQHVVTGEYRVNWFLFWDALTQNRTDGALIRFVTPFVGGEPEAAADARLTAFAAAALAELGPYVPD
jgi:EpsI family protein